MKKLFALLAVVWMAGCAATPKYELENMEMQKRIINAHIECMQEYAIDAAFISKNISFIETQSRNQCMQFEQQLIELYPPESRQIAINSLSKSFANSAKTAAKNAVEKLKDKESYLKEFYKCCWGTLKHSISTEKPKNEDQLRTLAHRDVKTCYTLKFMKYINITTGNNYALSRDARIVNDTAESMIRMILEGILMDKRNNGQVSEAALLRWIEHHKTMSKDLMR